MPSSRWLKPVPTSAPEKSVERPSNVSMSDLRRIQEEKRRREEESHTVPQQGIPQEAIPQSGISPEGILRHGTQKPKKKKPAIDGSPKLEVSAERGYYPTFNDLDDTIIPSYRLDTFEQSVIRRLYRLSRGFRSTDCEIGLGSLSKACNISRSKAQDTINKLLAKGLIRSLGYSQSGTKYRVLEELPAIPQRSIPQQGIPESGAGIPQEASHGIPQEGNNKNNKDFINTHTNTGDVGVCSKFTLEECRHYAESLRSDGITNPGGYATAIYRSGEADLLIEAFLNPAPVELASDFSTCPDCKGGGFYYPEGPGGGVARCKHERLKEEGVNS